MRERLGWDVFFVMEHDDLRRASDLEHFGSPVSCGGRSSRSIVITSTTAGFLRPNRAACLVCGRPTSRSSSAS